MKIISCTRVFQAVGKWTAYVRARGSYVRASSIRASCIRAKCTYTQRELTRKWASPIHFAWFCHPTATANKTSVLKFIKSDSAFCLCSDSGPLTSSGKVLQSGGGLVVRIRIRYTLLSHKQRNYSVVLKHLNNLHHSTHLQPIFNIRHLATWNYEIIINNSKYHTFVYHIIINITLSSTTFYCTISLICSVPFWSIAHTTFYCTSNGHK